MKQWSWSFKSCGAAEWFILALAIAVQFDGPYFYSDTVRGIAIGLFVAALASMLAGRHALGTLVSALGIWTSSGMQPRTHAHTSIFVITQVIVALALVPAIVRMLPRFRQPAGEPTSAAS